MTSTNPLFDSAWVPTDKGNRSLLGALQEARTIQWGRGDWDYATLLVLHAMVQTAVALHPSRCPDSDAWLELLHAPPADLADWFAGPEFQAGPTPWQSLSSEGALPAYSLLIDAPGENTLKSAKDIMSWHENMPTALTQAEALIAVIADNYWGTARGRGYYQGCRGGQACTVLVEPVKEDASLWTKVWLNILPKDIWDNRYPTDKPFAFPWHIERKPAATVTRNDTNPLEMLWQMPRRWRTVVDADGMVRTVHHQSRGIQYTGDWDHPLTPHRYGKQKEVMGWSPVKLKTTPHLTDWAVITMTEENCTQPSAVVQHCQAIQRDAGIKVLRLRCVGWNTLGNPLGAWVDTALPFYAAPKMHQTITPLVQTTKEIGEDLKKSRNNLVNKRKSMQNCTDVYFSKVTAQFYALLGTLQPDQLVDLKAWETRVYAIAQNVLWEQGQRAGLDLAQIAKALHGLKPKRTTKSKRGASA